MKKRKGEDGCRPEVREVLDRLFGDPGWLKRKLLYAKSLMGWCPGAGLPTLDGMLAEDVVSEAYARVGSGKRRVTKKLKTRAANLEDAVDKLIYQTISSIVYVARVRQSWTAPMTSEDGTSSFEPEDESSPEFRSTVFAPLFPTEGFKDRVARHVLELHARDETAAAFGVGIGRIYKIVSKYVLPRVNDAIQDGFLETARPRAFHAA